MHMEYIHWAGEPAAKALASKNTVREFDLHRPVMGAVPQVSAPRNCALRGLIFAVPVALSLWLILGLAVWAIVR